MKTQNITEEIKSYLIDKLNDYSGCSSYGCDLAYLLTEGENANGSVYCSTYETKKLIEANFDLFWDFVEYYNDNFDDKLNPFREPEKCHVIFLVESVSLILQKCSFINNHWNDKIELTKQNIKKIIKDVEKFEEIEF